MSIWPRNAAKFISYRRKKIKSNFTQGPNYDDRFRGEMPRNFDEIVPLFLAVSPRNRQFTSLLFLPVAINLRLFLYGHSNMTFR